MKLKSDIFVDAVAVVTDIALLNTVFLSFSFPENGTALEIGYLPWFVCGLIIYFANYAFLKKPRAVPAIFGLNCLLFAAQTAVLFSYSANLRGAVSYAIAVAALIFTAGREYYLVLTTQKPEQRIVYTEIIIFTVLWFYFVQISDLAVPVSYNIIMFSILILNIATMIKFRVTNGRGSTMSSSRWTAALIFFVIFVALALLILVITVFLSDGMRVLSVGIVSFFITIVKTVLSGIAAVIRFLFSLLPAVPMGEMNVPPTPYYDAPYDAAVAVPIDSSLKIILTVLAAAVILTIIGFLLIRFRHARITSVFGGERLKQAKERQDKRSFLRKLLHYAYLRIKFFVLSIIYRNTAVGLYLRIERFGRKHKMPRLPGETQKKYIERVVRSLNVLTEESVLPLFIRLSDELDYRYYSNNVNEGYPFALSPSEISSAKIKIRKAGRHKMKKTV